MHRRGLSRTAWFFAVLLLATGAVGVSAFASTRPDPGFHVVTVKKAGFSIEVPDTWVEIDFTKGQVAKLVQQIRGELPELAALLPADPEQYVQQHMKLIAIDAALGDVHGNVSAVLTSTSRGLPPKREIKKYYDGVSIRGRHRRRQDRRAARGRGRWGGERQSKTVVGRGQSRPAGDELQQQHRR